MPLRALLLAIRLRCRGLRLEAVRIAEGAEVAEVASRRRGSSRRFGTAQRIRGRAGAGENAQW